MKKKTAQVSQPDKAETSNIELLIVQNSNPKIYRNHNVFDCHTHTHGRVNKFPFGSSHGPLFF
ncbi:hypothetical protein [Mucilaginibacter sp.]